jgi:hypothetical protein
MEKLRKEGTTHSMRKVIWAVIFGAGMLTSIVFAAQVGSPEREPMTFALDCAGGDCPLLNGAPQTPGGGLRFAESLGQRARRLDSKSRD